jgi:cell division septation protein DedD
MPKKKSKSRKTRNRYRIELTPLSIFFWGLSFVFILAWIFVLGIFVGRGLLPSAVPVVSELRAQVGKLQGFVGNNPSDEVTRSSEPEPDPRLDFFDKLSTKIDEAKKGSEPKRNQGTSRKETPQKVARAPQQELPLRKRRDDVEDKRTKNETVVPKVHFTVQLASLGDKTGAEKWIKRLISRGYPAYYYEVDVDGRTFYRVRCGRFESRREAEIHAIRMQNKEGVNAFVARIE